MFNSIRSILYLCFSVVGVACFIVIALGLRQFQLSAYFTETTTLSERAIFAFGTIREQVTEALIVRDYDRVQEVIPEIEALNHTISRLYGNSRIPAQYKLAMADKIDLTGLVLSLRSLKAGGGKVATSPLALQREMRLIGERLVKVDRIITDQIRDTVVGFQLGMIGVMGLLISCASFILILLYRRAVKPLLRLSAQADEAGLTPDGFSSPPEAGEEIDRFVHSVNELLARLQQPAGALSSEQAQDAAVLLQTINETSNRLNTIINYVQLVVESAESDAMSQEQRDMLARAIDAAERLAEQWHESVSALSSSRLIGGQ